MTPIGICRFFLIPETAFLNDQKANQGVSEELPSQEAEENRDYAFGVLLPWGPFADSNEMIERLSCTFDI